MRCFVAAAAVLGSGTYAPPTVTGFMNGSCGPIVYAGCAFTLSLTSWQMACPTTAGSFSVSFLDTNPSTRFTATGVMA